ncbi:MAG: hypothetical protein AAF335_03060 [Bacteroidota bacterium]
MNLHILLIMRNWLIYIIIGLCSLSTKGSKFVYRRKLQPPKYTRQYETVDQALADYYTSQGDTTYFDEDNQGIFMKHMKKEGLLGRYPMDTLFLSKREDIGLLEKLFPFTSHIKRFPKPTNFPMPTWNHEVYALSIFEYCYKHKKAPTADDIQRIILQKNLAFSSLEPHTI